MRPLRAVVDLAVLAAGWALLLLSLTICAETLLRRFFGVSIQGLDEYGGYILAVGAGFGFSYALLERAHIRVDVLTRLLPAPLRAAADLLAAVTLLATAALIARAAIGVARSSWDLDARAVSPLQTPLIWPQGLWALALVLFALCCAGVTLKLAACLLRRDWASAARIGGTLSAEEELAAELEELRRRGGPDEP